MDAVSRAFLAVPRAGFLPPEERWHASYDGPIPIGLGQTNSQPRTVADMLRLLEVHPGQRVLDVGSGSGWTTALLAHLTGPTGRVIGGGAGAVPGGVRDGEPRHDPPALGDIDRAAPEVLGWPDGAPYDRILVSAEALSLPADARRPARLHPEHPGRMVVPVAGEMLLVVRAGPSGGRTSTGHPSAPG